MSFFFFGGNLCESKEPCDQSAGDCQQAVLNPSPPVALQIPDAISWTLTTGSSKHMGHSGPLEDDFLNGDCHFSSFIETYCRWKMYASRQVIRHQRYFLSSGSATLGTRMSKSSAENRASGRTCSEFWYQWRMAPRGMPLSAGWFGATLPLLYPVACGQRWPSKSVVVPIRGGLDSGEDEDWNHAVSCWAGAWRLIHCDTTHLQTMSGQNTLMCWCCSSSGLYISYIYIIPSSNQPFFSQPCLITGIITSGARDGSWNDPPMSLQGFNEGQCSECLTRSCRAMPNEGSALAPFSPWYTLVNYRQLTNILSYIIHNVDASLKDAASSRSQNFWS